MRIRGGLAPAARRGPPDRRTRPALAAAVRVPVDRRLPQLFADPIGANSTWITSHAIVLAVAWPLLLTAVFFPLSLHRYQRLGR
jgi:hypothetical protein